MLFTVPCPPVTGDEAADAASFAAWELEMERFYFPGRFAPSGSRILEFPDPEEAMRGSRWGRVTGPNFYTAPGRKLCYYLGAPEPSWLNYSPVPLFMSASRLARYRSDEEKWPVTPGCSYAIDSGAYIALSGNNEDVPWFLDADVYGGMITRFVLNNGWPPDFAAPQDWPCEPSVRAKTGLTVRQHQELTLANYLHLVENFPFINWIPVVQGWGAEDYLVHEQMYLDAGVDLAGAYRVGIGSICRRGHVPEIVEVLEQFADRGYRMHGFGIKTTALPIIGHLLTSADSMAWSDTARKDNIRLPECEHTARDGGLNDCRNCFRWALTWRERVLNTIRPQPRTEEVATVTAATQETKPTEEMIVPQPGATFLCPGAGCGRKATVTKAGKVGSHYKYGREKCNLVGKTPPEMRKSRVNLPAEQAAIDELADFLGAFMADAAAPAAGEEAETVLTPPEPSDGSGPVLFPDDDDPEATIVKHAKAALLAAEEGADITWGAGVMIARYFRSLSGVMREGWHERFMFGGYTGQVLHPENERRPRYLYVKRETGAVEMHTKPYGNGVAPFARTSLDAIGALIGRLDPTIVAQVHAAVDEWQSAKDDYQGVVGKAVAAKQATPDDDRRNYRERTEAAIQEGKRALAAAWWSLRPGHLEPAAADDTIPLATAPVGMYGEATGITLDGVPITARGFVQRVPSAWSGQRPGMIVVDLSTVRPPAPPHSDIMPVQCDPDARLTVLVAPGLAKAAEGDSHVRGTVRMPYDAQGMGPAGSIVPAWVCCTCGGVEVTEFTLELNHGCCTQVRTTCSLIKPKNSLNQHWRPPAGEEPVAVDPEQALIEEARGLAARALRTFRVTEMSNGSIYVGLGSDLAGSAGCSTTPRGAVEMLREDLADPHGHPRRVLVAEAIKELGAAKPGDDITWAVGASTCSDWNAITRWFDQQDPAYLIHDHEWSFSLPGPNGTRLQCGRGGASVYADGDVLVAKTTWKKVGALIATTALAQDLVAEVVEAGRDWYDTANGSERPDRDDPHLRKLASRAERAGVAIWESVRPGEPAGRVIRVMQCAASLVDAKGNTVDVPKVMRNPYWPDVQWGWTCTGPDCRARAWGSTGGSPTVAQARAKWFAHASQHNGMRPGWADDLVPEESPEEQRRIEVAIAKKTRLRIPGIAQIDIKPEPTGEWWTDSAKSWRQAGLLVRQGETVILVVPGGVSEGQRVADLLIEQGGVPVETMNLYEVSDPTVPLESTWLNDDETLARLFAEVDTPLNGRNGRGNARELAERYGNGLPLVRHNRKIGQEWTFVCPVPACQGLYDGHETVREIRAHWFEHALGHGGFTPAWDDEAFPVEPEVEAKPQPERKLPARPKRPRHQVPVVMKIYDPPLVETWWGDRIAEWEADEVLWYGLHAKSPLERSAPTTEHPYGRRSILVKMPFNEQATAAYAKLLCGVSGLSENQIYVYRAAAAPERGAEIPKVATATAKKVTPRKVAAPAPAKRVAAKPKPKPVVVQESLFDLDLLDLDAFDALVEAAESEPKPMFDLDLLDLDAAVVATPAKVGWHDLLKQADAILETCTTETPKQLVAWAVGVSNCCHAQKLVHWWESGEGAQLYGGISGGGSVGAANTRWTDHSRQRFQLLDRDWKPILTVRWAPVGALVKKDKLPADLVARVEAAHVARRAWLKHPEEQYHKPHTPEWVAADAQRREIEQECLDSAVAVWAVVRPQVG